MNGTGVTAAAVLVGIAGATAAGWEPARRGRVRWTGTMKRVLDGREVGEAFAVPFGAVT